MDTIFFGACCFCFGLTCGWAYFRKVYLDPFDALRFSGERRNEIIESAARYVECLEDGNDAAFYAGAVRELKGVES